MYRKMLSLLLVLVLTLGAFGTTAFAEEEKVLKVAMSSGDLPVDGTATIEKMFAKFEEEYNCDVELVVIAHDGWSDYLTKLQTMMVSGNAPDVFQNPHEGGRMANAWVSLPRWMSTLKCTLKNGKHSKSAARNGCLTRGWWTERFMGFRIASSAQ